MDAIPLTPVKRAAAAVGGVPRLAELLNCTRQAIYQWDRVPADRVLEIERLAGVSRHDLRPDLYPEEASARRKGGK